MKNLILIFAIFIFSIQLYSKTVINVHMPGAAGIYAQLKAYNDYINYDLTNIDSNFVNEFDKFSFIADINQSIPVIIQVRFIRIRFFVEPNKTYNIRTEKIDFEDPDIYPKSVVGYLSPKFEILESKQNEINNIISIFYDDYKKFIDTNYLNLIRKQNSVEIVKKFENHSINLKDSFQNNYFNSLVDLELAQLNLLSRNYNEKYLLENYFNQNNIDLNNYHFMEFFNSYYENYLFKYRAYKFIDLDSVINTNRSYNDLYRLVQKDSLIKDSLLTELLILTSMPAIFNSRAFDKKAVLDILSDISTKGQNEEVKKAARQMQYNLRRLLDNQKAANFKLYGLDGEIYELNDFLDKYTYILVWTSTCKECYAELRMLNELNADMDDIINFIAVSIDAKPQLARKVKENYQLNFKILNYNIDFIENYDIEIIPTAFLIDPKGNFISTNTPLPTNKFKEYFIKMLNKKKGNLD